MSDIVLTNNDLNGLSTKEIAIEIISKIQSLGNDIYRLSVDITDAIKRRPDLYDELIDMGADKIMIKRFMAIGCGKMYPQLLLESGAVYKELAKCNIEDQKKYYHEPIVVQCIGEGSKNYINVKIGDMTQLQCKQVFDNGKIRDLGSQRAYTESLKTEHTIKNFGNIAERPKYVIDKKGIVTQDGLRITKAEIIDIAHHFMK